MTRDALRAILDDTFHGCAFAAFVEAASRSQGWPVSEAVKRHAYDLYEDALRRRGLAETPDECHETVTHSHRSK